MKKHNNQNGKKGHEVCKCINSRCIVKEKVVACKQSEAEEKKPEEKQHVPEKKPVITTKYLLIILAKYYSYVVSKFINYIFCNFHFD